MTLFKLNVWVAAIIIWMISFIAFMVISPLPISQLDLWNTVLLVIALRIYVWLDRLGDYILEKRKLDDA